MTRGEKRDRNKDKGVDACGRKKERKRENLPRGSHKVGSVTHHPWGKRGGNLQIEFRKSEYLILYQRVGKGAILAFP